MSYYSVKEIAEGLEKIKRKTVCKYCSFNQNGYCRNYSVNIENISNDNFCRLFTTDIGEKNGFRNI